MGMRSVAPLPVSAALGAKKPLLQLKHGDKFDLEKISSTKQGEKKGTNKLSKEPNSNKATRRGAIRELVKAVRSDGEAIKSASAPLFKVIEDFFWLRFLEKPPPIEQQDSSVSPTLHHDFPSSSSYPPGLSCGELIMADIEALKLYSNYFWHSLKTVSKPIPEAYDAQKVADYFYFRTHVLALRMFEITFAFLYATAKLYISKNIEQNFDDSKFYVGQVLKETLLYLGPTFIKVGQSLSTRPDIIGSEICEALSELHDKVPPFETEIAMKIIESELGCPLHHKFNWISDEPIAAASFGQVYKGCTRDGTIVAIKVQRPDLLHYVVRDLYILRLGLSILRKKAKRRSNIALYADEIGAGLVGELDYTLEASNASKFLEAHSRYGFMAVPKIIKELTRKRVLTMEWVSGENPKNLLSMSKGFDANNNKILLLDFVNKGVQSSLVQLLETGLLHADPHPGNLRYTPEGRIAFLDFGLICKMEKKHQYAMLASIVHIVNGDWAGLVSDLTLMDVVPPRTNLRRVTLDLEDALGEVTFNEGIPDIKFSKVLTKIWSIALKYQFRMPPYFTLVLRSLASLEGLAVAADPDFKTFQAAYPFVVRKLLYDNSLPSRSILYSAVLNRNKELQLQKVLLFLKLSSTRTDKSSEEFQTGSLILKLLSSKDGVVIRRLLMTTDGKSLARSVLSNEALFLRQYMIKTSANAIYQWIIKTRQLNRETENLRAIITDKRVKVIFFKIIKDLQRDPILMIRSASAFFRVGLVSAAMALHRFIVYLSEYYLTNFSFRSAKQMITNV